MAIFGTIVSVLIGLGLLIYALGYSMLNGAYTPNEQVPARVMIAGTIGLGFLALPWLL